MSNKSLDILEEQLFNLLNEYVPQTGRGFSDGNEYVGKKTKGPYEYVAEEDTPWYKKKYKEDSKNLKILIGHGSKTPKYAKKGGPFTQDPPKRRPVGKLSAPLMALDEMDLPPNFKDAFLKLTNAEVSFKALKDINAKVAFIDVLVFKKDKTYQGVITGDSILLSATEQGDKTLTKQEFLGKLEQAQGELCQSVDCKASTIKSNGKILTFDQFMQQANQPQQAEEPKPQPAAPEADTQKTKEAKQDSQIASGIGEKVANGASVQTAIKQELGYNPATKEFAKQFYSTMMPAIQKIEDPDEKKIAALTTVLFGEIALVPVEFMENVYSSIDPKVIQQLSGIVDSFIKQFAPELMKLKELYNGLKEKINKGKEAIERVLNPFKVSNLNDLPEAEQSATTVVVMGDKQKTSLLQAFKTYFTSKGYNKIGKVFDTPEGAEFAQLLSDPAIASYINANKDNIGLIFISLGTLNPTEAPQFYNVVSSLKEAAPKSKIVWVGSPPLQKGADYYLIKNPALEANNKIIKTGSFAQGKEFIFIDPTEYLSNSEEAGVYSDKTTLSPVGAKKVFDGALTGKKPEKKEPDKKEEPDDSVPMLPTDYIEGAAGVVKFKLLNEDLQKELIKLSKKAKQVFGDKAKIHIQSGQRKDSKNHAPGQAADIRISVDGTNKSAQETYAFIISSILDGTIKDGGVGYYANNKGVYDPKNMDVASEYPHYDIRDVRKWFWFNCESDLVKCKERVNAPRYFKSMEDHYQTSGILTAAQVADSKNPLSLPEDVFKLIGTYKPKEKKEDIKTTSVEKSPKVATKSEGSIEAYQYEGKEGRRNRAVKYPNGEIKIGGSVSWRNNNPGNIRSGRSLGGIGKANGFAVFETYEKGYEALKEYVRRYAFNNSKHTIETFMGEYAPTRDETTGKLVRINKKYGKIIADSLGVAIDTKTSSLKGNQAALDKFAEVIKGVEGYNAYKGDRKVISPETKELT